MYHPVQTSLKCVTNATNQQLSAWWETIQADSEGLRWFSDSFPTTYVDFVTTLQSGLERYTLFFADREVAGSYWLHDIVDDDPDLPPCAWLRGYVAPTYRGNFTADAWPIARSIFEGWGYHNIFAASHAGNKRAIACLIKNMQFTLVDSYPDFAIFAGKLTHCTVCAMHQRDVDLARHIAMKRAERLIFSV